MKNILIIFILAILPGCFSSGTVVEDYQKTPQSARSVGEGRRTYSFFYKGKSYILEKGSDGRFYAQEETRVSIPKMPPMPNDARGKE